MNLPVVFVDIIIIHFVKIVLQYIIILLNLFAVQKRASHPQFIQERRGLLGGSTVTVWSGPGTRRGIVRVVELYVQYAI